MKPSHMVRISILDTTCPISPFEKKLTFLEQVGIEGIEINDSFIREATEKRLGFRECLSSSHIQLSAIHLGFRGELRSPFPSVRRRIEALIYESLRFCAEMEGEGVITIPSYKKGTFPYWLIPISQGKKGILRLIEEYRILGKFAEEFGIPLMIEPIDRRYVDLVTTCSSGASICKESGSDMVRLCPDLFHMSIEGERIPEVLNRYGELISHLHVCDRDPGKPFPLLPGSGVLDFGKIQDALDAIGYRGYYSIDIETEKEKITKDLLLRSVQLLRHKKTFPNMQG